MNIRDAAATLPEQERRAFTWSRSYGHTPREIALLMELPQAEVDELLSKAIRHFAAALEKNP